MNRMYKKIRSILEILVKVNKRFDEISPKIEILLVYMFIGLTAGVAVNVKYQISKTNFALIYFGCLYTTQVLYRYCKKNELKIFKKMDMGLLGFIIAIISFVISTFPINILSLYYLHLIS